MSPFNKSKMTHKKGSESGQTTNDERDRIEPIGSDAATSRETTVTKRSGRDAGGERPASQTLVEGISPGWRKWADQPTAWEGE